MVKNVDDELRGRIERGGPLTAEDLRKLKEAIAPKLGRPKRDALKTLRDELGRAAAYAIARADGKKYGDAIEAASTAMASSERRIKGSFAWLKEVAGIDRKELERMLALDRDLASRIRGEGLAGLTAKEVVTLGIISAHIAALQAEFSFDEQAELFIDGSVGGLFSETFDRTLLTLQRLVEIAAHSGLPFPANDNDELNALVDYIAAPIAKDIAMRIRGCIK